MNVKKIGILIALLLAQFWVFSQDVWTLRDSVNGSGRSIASTFVLDGQGWIVAGLDEDGFKRKMYSYNPNQDDWDDEISLGGENGDGLERGSAVAFSLKGKGYVCTGQGDFAAFSKDLWEYDPIAQTWSQKADFIGEARRQAVAFTLDNYAYVGTGQALSGLKKDFYRYDATLNVWAPIADFAGTPRRQAVSFVIGAQAYVATGDDGVARNDLWQYYPATNAWVQKASLPGVARTGASAWAIGNSGFIALGEGADFSYLKDVWQYYYYSNTWVQRSDFPSSPRKSAIAFVIDDVAYVGTGYDGSFKDDFYSYTAILSLQEEKNKVEVSVFPNPSSDWVWIQMGEFQSDEVEVLVYSSTGQLVNKQIEFYKKGSELQMNLAYLSEGNYVYQLLEKENKVIYTGKITRM